MTEQYWFGEIDCTDIVGKIEDLNSKQQYYSFNGIPANGKFVNHKGKGQWHQNSIFVLKNGMLHNESGPAKFHWVERRCYCEFFINGIRHNEFGPSDVYHNDNTDSTCLFSYNGNEIGQLDPDGTFHSEYGSDLKNAIAVFKMIEVLKK